MRTYTQEEAKELIEILIERMCELEEEQYEEEFGPFEGYCSALDTARELQLSIKPDGCKYALIMESNSDYMLTTLSIPEEVSTIENLLMLNKELDRYKRLANQQRESIEYEQKAIYRELDNKRKNR